MRILHIIPRYEPARGGAEAHMAEFSRRFAAGGHDVTVATTDALSIEVLWDARQERIGLKRETLDGVDVLRFPLQHLPLSALSFAAIRRLLWLLSRLRAPLPLLLSLARLTPRVPALRAWLKDNEAPFDIVAGTGIAFEGLLADGLQFARERRLPFVAYPFTHLGAGEQPGKDSLSAFYTMRHQIAIVRGSTAALMQTPSERGFYASQGVPAARLPVVGSGVTPGDVTGGSAERFCQKHAVNGPIVFSLGTMSFDKGTFHVVAAVQKLWEEGRQVELFLAGAVLESFRRHLAQLPPTVRDRIHVLGQIDDQEKRDLLAACDVFVLPSRTDSFGIVYLEAWLYRKPVIAASTWGVCDVVEDGSDGLLVPFGDVRALSEAIDRLLANPALAAALGESGERKVFQYHTWETKFEQARAIYERLVQ